jgi:hypothetical protein
VFYCHYYQFFIHSQNLIETSLFMKHKNEQLLNVGT